MPTLTSRPLDTLIIGAGPAGIGTALALGAIKDLIIGVVDAGSIGNTFRQWPADQMFLTPSFTGNGFGATDLNSIHPETSPAFSIGKDYLTGTEYARYLTGVATHFRVPVLTDTTVTDITHQDGSFRVETNRGPVTAQNVVWAGGEFHNPCAPRIAGAEHADHTSTPDAWTPRHGPVVIIGGYESGIDLACHHAGLGTQVVVVDPEHPWNAKSGSDPSFRLSPRTRQRLAAAQATGLVSFVEGRVSGIRKNTGSYSVAVSGITALQSEDRPTLATGYGPGLGPASLLFETRPDGWPIVDDNDESTRAPGLFLAGAALRHGGLKFCFVYKFRQRFAHIAHTIATRHGKDTTPLETWRAAGMLTDDLSCCGIECAC